MELQTEVPQTGTKVRIDADRGFEGQSGDSILHVQGQSTDGSPTFDAAYVEVNAQEAEAISHVLRWIGSPTPQMLDKVAQEVQATFSSKLGGRDAQQIAQLTATAVRQLVGQWIGAGSDHQVQEQVDTLAERFERAAAKRRQRYAGQGETAGKSGK